MSQFKNLTLSGIWQKGYIGESNFNWKGNEIVIWWRGLWVSSDRICSLSWYNTVDKWRGYFAH